MKVFFLKITLNCTNIMTISLRNPHIINRVHVIYLSFLMTSYFFSFFVKAHMIIFLIIPKVLKLYEKKSKQWILTNVSHAFYPFPFLIKFFKSIQGCSISVMYMLTFEQSYNFAKLRLLLLCLFR